MTPRNILSRTVSVGFDSSPFIYYVEGNAVFELLCAPFFDAIDSGEIEGFTSSLSLTETLVHPLKNGDTHREKLFHDLLLNTQGMITLLVSTEIAETAARLRANYPLRTPDAVQIATAIHAHCDIFLTNDDRLKQIKEIEVVIVSELT